MPTSFSRNGWTGVDPLTEFLGSNTSIAFREMTFLFRNSNSRSLGNHELFLRSYICWNIKLVTFVEIN